MSMVNEQAIFFQDLCKLGQYSSNVANLIVTGGELFRTPEQQDLYIRAGKSWTQNSMHLNRCAIDLNFFEMINGVPTLIGEKSKLQAVGDFWESLDPKNSWGGNWKTKIDCPHFERRA
jgi:hypothetical protein